MADKKSIRKLSAEARAEAMPKTVLPMPGRAATTTSSPGR